MSERKYVRPKLTHACLVNPNRSGGQHTDAERRITTIARNKIAQRGKTFDLVFRQYDAPFFYENFGVELGRPWENATNRAAEDLPEDQWGIMTDTLRVGYVGAEFNEDGIELDVPPYGAITFVEEDPVADEAFRI